MASCRRLLKPATAFSISHHTKLLPSSSITNRIKFSTSTTLKMPSYIVTCKDDASPEQVQAAKQHAVDQGGKIEHEYTLIKGFSVSYPEGTVTTLGEHEHVNAVELDQEVRTQ